MSEKEIDKRVFKEILKTKFELSVFSIFLCIIGIVIICLIFFGVFNFKVQIWYLILGIIVICLIIYIDKDVILDYIKLDIVCEQAKELSLSLFKRTSSYDISYIDKRGDKKKLSMSIPTGRKKYRWFNSPRRSQMLLYYTKRSKVFLGLQCIECNEDISEEYKDLFL